MRITRLSVCVLLMGALLSAVGCAGRSSDKKAELVDSDAPATDTVLQNKMDAYPIPVPPENTTGEDRIAYVLLHFWDSFDFKDKTVYDNADYSEQALANFIGLFPQASLHSVNNGIQALLEKVSVNPEALAVFSDRLKLYLYNPSSPAYNDLYYEMVLRYLVKAKAVDATEKERLKILLNLVQKNQIGTLAKDFSFIEANGKSNTLFNIKAEHTFLMFYEPGCHACQTTIAQMKAIPQLHDAIESGTLRIVLIYAHGEEQTWNDYKAQIPSEWINGMDTKQQIVRGQLYDLKASPTIYLLDKHKKVNLKDATLEQVLNSLFEK